METSIRISEIAKIVKSVSGADGAIRKRNIIRINSKVDGLFEVLAYSLGMIDPGFKVSDIDRPVFCIAPPRIYKDWDDLMRYYLRHPGGEDDNIVVTHYFLRQQKIEEREDWHYILAKQYRVGNELYLIHQFYDEEAFDESSYIRFRHNRKDGNTD